MARLSEDQINEIRARADIVDIISHYVPLTRKGKNYVCTCPFHDDHDPSLTISPDKQIFKCFVCGTGGNVFTFVQKYEQISFLEAVYKVAQYTGIPLDESILRQNQRVEADPKKTPLYKVNQDTIEFTQYQLSTSSAASIKQYLYQRGVSDEIIKLFEIGYHPEGNALYKFLHAKKHSDENLIAAGVCAVGANGIHDIFSDRIMIPIHDAYGNPVGFTARTTKQGNEAKYINTAQTSIYEKGQLIFNYHRAKAALRERKRVFLTEGAMDVIAFAKVGIHSAIATLGTACTKEQIKAMKLLRSTIIVCYDGDRAGRQATYKFGKLALANQLPFEIVDNQLGLDPDEIIVAYGKEELLKISKKTISWVEFLFTYLSQTYNLENYSQRKEFALELAEQIALLPNEFERQSAFVRLQEITGFDMRSSVESKSAPKRFMKNEKSVRNAFLARPKDGATSAQYTILSQMLVSKSASNRFRDELGFLIDDACKKLAYYIMDFYRNHAEMDVAALLDVIKEEQVKKLLLEISEWELARESYDSALLSDALNRIRMLLLDEQIRKLNEEIANVSDAAVKAKLGDEKNALIRKKGGMREWRQDK